MIFSEQQFKELLDANETGVSEDEFSAFLEGETKPTQTSPGAGPVPLMEASLPDDGTPTVNDLKPREPRYADLVSKRDQDIYGEAVMTAGEYSYAANRAVVSALGLPADAFNWVLGRAGIESRTWGGSEDLLEVAEKLGISGRKQFHSATSKAGDFTGLGLTFLAPFLHLGKGTAVATKMGEIVEPTAGVTKGVMQTIANPFVRQGKAALATELGASTGAGMGSYYMGEEYGQPGELIGGLVGGLPAMGLSMSKTMLGNYAKRKIAPFTEAGGRYKAGLRLRALSETDEVVKDITKTSEKMIPGTAEKVAPAKRSKDSHLIALHNKVIEEDPHLAHQLYLNEQEVIRAARKEVEAMKGGVPIAETQAYIKGQVDHVKTLIDQRVRSAIEKSKNAVKTVSTAASRKDINNTVNENLHTALKEARDVENEVWSAVEQTAPIATNTIRAVLKDHLQKISRVELEDSGGKYFPKVIQKYFGALDKKGNFKGGVYSQGTVLKEMHGARKTLTTLIRKEKAEASPDWNAIRIWDDMQEAILKDIAESPKAKDFEAALGVSRELNQKFKGGVLSAVFGHEKTGGKMPAGISLEGIPKSGPKAAEEIKRVLAASPESKGLMEDLVKLKLARSASITQDGQMNLAQAKRWASDNEDILDIFPQLKADLDNAIGLNERAAGIATSQKEAIKTLEKSSLSKLAELKVGRVINEVMSSKNPKLAMREMYQRSNKVGRQGLKDDVIDRLMKKGASQEVDQDGYKVLSGDKMLVEWNANKEIYKEVLSKDEIKRLESIIERLRVVRPSGKLPTVSDVLVPERGIVSIAITTIATRAGAQLGKGTSGASLRTAALLSRLSDEMMGKLDIGAAKRLLRDATTDEKLYKTLYADVTKPKEMKEAMQVLQGWIVANQIEGMDNEE